jgi:hypothetical protein
MSVSLLFPPATDPRAPHLALPALAAAARGAGIETELRDLDIEGLLWLLEATQLATAADRLRRQTAQTPATRRLLGLAEGLVGGIDDMVAALRDERFYDPVLYNDARTAIADALDIHCAASPGVSYGIGNVCYDVRGVNPAEFADLVRVTADPRCNLFDRAWADGIFQDLERRRPELVGISLTNRQQLIPGLYLARELKRRQHFVVLGGTLLAKFAKSLAGLPEFFQHFADAVVLYEGETSLLALVDALRGDGDLAAVPNLMFNRRGAVTATAVHVEDVNRLPTPDFSGLPLSSYLAPRPVLPILTGKGCYFNRCKFCDIPFINHVSRKPYRLRSPDRVVQDCLTLHARHGARHFVITDEALSPKLLLELADRLRPHQDLDLNFTGYARLEPGFNQEVCEAIARAGFRKLFFGLESGSQRTLDHMDKGIQVRDAPAILRRLRAAGVLFHIFSIVGFPEEDEASALETLAFFDANAAAIDHPGNSFDVHPFGLDLRTPYAAEADQYGVVIRPEALTRRFAVSVDRSEWEAQRGLTRDEAAALIARFTRRLREIFKRSHNYPGHVWPGFEEYAVLYADRYRRLPFRHGTSAVEGQEYRVRSARWVVREAADGAVVLHGREGRMAIAAATLEFLFRGGFHTAEARRRWFAGAAPAAPAEALESRFAALVDALAGAGLALVEAADPDGPRP